MDKVSVIIPTYKRPEKLVRALKSVIRQSYSNFEIFVVNDDEDDQSVLNVINDINDIRINYLKNSLTKGANGARNTGILESTGSYIAFLDDDDEWLCNKLENQIIYLKRKPDDFGGVYSGYLIERKNKWREYLGLKEGGIFSEVLLDEVKICAGSNLLIKAEVIDKIGLWDEELLRQQDLEFLIRFLNHFKLAYDNNIVAKIYGHNTPNPKKAFEEREKYEKKILKFLNMLSSNGRDQFYSNHFRRQTMYLFKLEDFKLAKVYWKKAKSNKQISIKKDFKILFLYIKSILKTL